MENCSRGVIFDLDGTLYTFDDKQYGTFGRSKFYKDLRSRTYDFISTELGVGSEDARNVFDEIMEKYQGELSLGFESEYGIDRYKLFANTWDCDPAQYITSEGNLAENILSLGKNTALVTAAPRVWADRVLEFLGLVEVFEDRIISGEPNVRKPNPEVFRQAADMMGLLSSSVVSVGDQNYSDIIPAKTLGMPTVLIGPEQLDADYRVDNIGQAIELVKRV